MKIFMTCILMFVKGAYSSDDVRIINENKKIRLESYTEFEKPLLQHEYFVDKSLLIETFLRSERYIFVTRPPRWGKSINVNMLKKFLQIQVDQFGTPVPENTNKILFDGGCFLDDNNRTRCLKKLKISQKFPDLVNQHQGKYPVIHLNFKNLFHPNYNNFTIIMSDEMRKIYKEFYFLKKYYETADVNELGNFETLKLKEYMEGSQKIDLQHAIILLIKFLRIHFRSKIFVFIEDYDEILTRAYLTIKNIYHSPNIYEDYSTLFEKILSIIFDDNMDVGGMITGVLNVALPEEILGEYTLLHTDFSDHFGFTEDEVLSLLSKRFHKIELSHFKQWYNGYVVGGRTVYSPGSVIRCLTNNGNLKIYQTERLNLQMIAKIPISDRIKYELGRMLVSNASIIAELKKTLDPYSIGEREEFYTFLLFYGYFKAVHTAIERYNCTIVNHEMKSYLLENLSDKLK